MVDEINFIGEHEWPAIEAAIRASGLRGGYPPSTINLALPVLKQIWLETQGMHPVSAPEACRPAVDAVVKFYQPRIAKLFRRVIEAELALQDAGVTPPEPTG
jgi:hypothetical protein